MSRALWFTFVAVAFRAAIASQSQSHALSMQELTLPLDKMGGPCGLSASPSISEPNSTGDGSVQVRGGLWARLPITKNPWTGTDRPTIAEIRRRIDPPPPLPDPPRTRAEGTSTLLARADGIDEGYVAVYTEKGSTDLTELVVVYALRFMDGRIPFKLEIPMTTTSIEVPKANTPATRIVFGPTVVVVSGNRGPCFQLVESHIRSLAK